MSDARLSGNEVRKFVFDQTLYAFDPATLARAAAVHYRPDWTCQVTMEDGSVDQGQYGFEDDLYWTRYTRFRDGAVHRFYLERIDPDTAQARFEDGTRAFVQSPLPQLAKP